MRMWMSNPAIMCRQHLLGEHLECHMFVGSIVKGISMKGYINKGLLDPSSLQSRHDALADEMLKRGYNHDSPLSFESSYHCKIDVIANLKELTRRCSACASNINPNKQK
jgi:hypothetical protein